MKCKRCGESAGMRSLAGDLCAVCLRDDLDAITLELERLTPGGSEFVRDPDRCIAWIRERLATVAKIAAERNDLRGEVMRLKLARRKV